MANASATSSSIKTYLQKCVQLVFGFLKEFLVNGLEWQFTERGQLDLLQSGKTLGERDRKRGRWPVVLEFCHA